METIVKNNIFNLKEEIKAMAEKQKFYKNQRKTVKLVGERKMSASDATYEHQRNGEKLRVMYAVYGLLRGKKFSEIENHYPEENHPLNKLQYRIDTLLSKYQLQEVENK